MTSDLYKHAIFTFPEKGFKSSDIVE